MNLDKKKITQELGIPGDLYDKLMRDFIKQAEEEIPKLDKAMAQDDFEAIAKIAHLIKGSSGNLRLEEIQGVAKDIELAGRQTQDKKLRIRPCASKNF